MRKLGFVSAKDYKRAVFYGANTGDLYHSWSTQNFSGNAELRHDLKKLRARSRQLSRDNEYMKKFLRMVKTNIVGREGIKLQSMAMDRKNEGPDDLARTKIEEAFKDFSKRGNCDVSGNYSFRDIQSQIMTSMARDGEVIIRRIFNFDNKYKYALQLIEADHLDDNYNQRFEDGRAIKMGIELNQYGRPIAYHLFKDHPGDIVFPYGYSIGEKVRIPASEILHLFIPQRISQNRGLPWIHAAMNRINMFDGYQEAELVASRVAAAKGGFYKKIGEGQYIGDDKENNQPIQEATPGHFEILPGNMDFQDFNPQHPTTAYEAFVKTTLKGIASGIDVSYNYLANDLEGVNYSSIRAGVLDERDVWRDLQAWLIEHFLQIIFQEFIEMAIYTGNLALPGSEKERWFKALWQPRGWQWVDPQKDIMAAILALKAGIDTHSNICARLGTDYEENLKQLSAEKKLREKYKVTEYDVLLELLAKTGVLNQNEEKN